LLHDHGVDLGRRQIALDQNGDFNLNLNARTASQLHHGGLINDSQLGAILVGGQARFSFALEVRSRMTNPSDFRHAETGSGNDRDQGQATAPCRTEVTVSKGMTTA
jgi:conjugal transfer mating pair stabilization protein TraG